VLAGVVLAGVVLAGIVLAGEAGADRDTVEREDHDPLALAVQNGEVGGEVDEISEDSASDDGRGVTVLCHGVNLAPAVPPAVGTCLVRYIGNSS
jgi:hypothetical protein